jgi:hypothetical protein
MATLSSLTDRVRVELGDLGKSFVTQFVADGTTNRFKLHYSPLDGEGVMVFKDGVDISNDCSVEESTGVLVTDTLPADGAEFTVSGNYYRYFTQTEMNTLVNDALVQHTAHARDSIGRQITIDNLPAIEEYPVAIYAVTLALYTLATDSAFDIDIQAPDGVTIPRAERFRQLMEMVNTRREQYRELCTLLGVGMYKIDVFSFRRISKATGRYIPVYKPQEVDDRSFPERVDLPIPVYGDYETPWPTQSEELTAYQGVAYYKEIPFTASVYLSATITNVTSTGTAVTYTASNNYAVGQPVTITGVTPTAYNLTDAVVTAATSTTFTVASAATGTYVSGGIADRSAAVTGATGTGANITYTANNKFAVGDRVTVSGVSPEGYNVVGAYITAVTPTTFKVSGSTTGAFVSAGTAMRIGNGVIARALPQRGAVLAAQHFALDVVDNYNGTYTAKMSLTDVQTRLIANRTYWQIATVDPLTDIKTEVLGGNFFTVRRSQAMV